MTDAGIGQSTCVGHRRRPDHRDAVPRGAQAVRRRSGDRGDRPHRRDRRCGRGGSGGVGRRASPGRAEGRVHRRADRAGGQADGPRRRDHLRAAAGRRPPRSRRSRRPASASRARPPSCRRSFARPATATEWTLSDIRFLFGYDRWATQRILAMLPGIDDDVWTADDAVGSRGLGADRRPHAGRPSALAARDRADRRGGPVPRTSRCPASEALTDAWAEEWAAVDELLEPLTTSCSPSATTGVADLADARARREPRHAAPERGGRPAHRGRALAGTSTSRTAESLAIRTSPARSRELLTRATRDGADAGLRRRDAFRGVRDHDPRRVRRSGAHGQSDGPRRGRHPRDPAGVAVDDLAAFETGTASPPTCPRRRPRPDLARPVSEAVRSVTGGDEPVRLPRRAHASSTDPATRPSEPSSGSTATGSRPWPRVPDEPARAVAGRWIDLLEEELGHLPREEKPWIRNFAGADRRLRRARGPRPGRDLRLVAV